MEVMRGLGEGGSGTRLAGVDNLMLHFTPYDEDWVEAAGDRFGRWMLRLPTTRATST